MPSPTKAELLEYFQRKLEENKYKSQNYGDRLLSPENRGQQNSISQPGPGVEDPSMGEKLATGGMALSNLPMTGASILLQKLQDHLFPDEPSLTDSLIPDPLTGELKPTQKSESFMPYIGRNNPKIRAQYKKVFGFDPFEPIVVKRAQKEAGTDFKTSSGRGSVFMEGKPLGNENPKTWLKSSAYEDDGKGGDLNTVGGDKVLIGQFSPQNPLIVKGGGSPGKPGLEALLGHATDTWKVNPMPEYPAKITSTTSGKDYRAHNPKLEGRLKSHWFDKEKVLAEQAKRGGYDSAITYNDGPGATPISEIMDFQAPTQHRVTPFSTDGSLATKNKIQIGVPGVEREKLIPKIPEYKTPNTTETLTGSAIMPAKKWDEIEKTIPKDRLNNYKIHDIGKDKVLVIKRGERDQREYDPKLYDNWSKLDKLTQSINNKLRTKPNLLPIEQKIDNLSSTGSKYEYLNSVMRNRDTYAPTEHLPKFSPQDFLDLVQSLTKNPNYRPNQKHLDAVAKHLKTTPEDMLQNWDDYWGGVKPADIGADWMKYFK